ncbi:MAG TPA: CmcI family methyltransferase [Caulobacteraceae bacterium]|nr:CmcI family methyltransferase [Caulobacteraceae bacterium]
MSLPDDRAAFEAEKTRSVLALGADAEVFDLALKTVVAADRHRYTYLWSWMGAPIIQMPADIVAMQEVIWATKPDVIVETGVARGGSVIFSASMLTLIGKGKVIGVDIDIRAHNRDTIETHPMAGRITLIEGSSIAPETLTKVRAEIPAGASVMVCLDSDHSRDHVLEELRLYGPLVTAGQYLVCADTVLGRMTPEQTPKARSKVWLPGDEPLAAVEAYLAETDRFEADPLINGKMIVASSPGGYLRCLR